MIIVSRSSRSACQGFDSHAILCPSHLQHLLPKMSYITLKTKRKSKDGSQVSIRVLKEKLDLGVDVKQATVDDLHKAIKKACM